MKKNLLIGMAALLMAGLTSCSSDDVVADNNRPLETDQSFFANIAISNIEQLRDASDKTYDGTSDPDFEVGKEEENQVSSVYLIFYDEDGNRVSTTQIRKDLNNATEGEAFNSGNFIYRGVVQIDVKHGSKKPAYVMCFINPITSSNFEINPNFATLESLQQTTRPRIIDDNNNFAMSKSVYFGVNRTKNPNVDSNNENYYEKIIATPLVYKSNLFDTEKDAQDALNDEKEGGVVDIYVERYAAKVSLSIENQNNQKVVLTDEYTLEFVPEYWAVNAYEEKTYVCKSFLSNDGEHDLSYRNLIDAFGGVGKAWKWNNPTYHRCYWAQSPAYYAAEYPRVADDIIDNGKTSYALRYYSYSDMATNADGTLIAKARTFTETQAIYARENTVSGNALVNAYNDPAASPKAAVASAVIVGSYKLKKGEKYVTIPEGEMFYIAGNKVNGYTVYENTDAMMNYFVRTTIPFAKNSDGDQFFNYNEGKFTDWDYKTYFKVMHPTAAAREDLIIDSRYVTIQLDNAKISDDTPLYAYLDGKYVQVTTDNVDKINQQMLYAAGTVQGFLEGKVYYNIPIKHLGFYRKDNANAEMSGTEATFDWTKVKSGDFGLVRNHSYTIKVDKIEGLGNGIPNPNDPIVPPTDPEDYYIGARIIVLNWAIVPTQHVTL